MHNKQRQITVQDYPYLVSEYLKKRDMYKYRADNTVLFNQFCNNYDGRIITNRGRNQNVYIGYPWCKTICPFCVYTSGRIDKPASIEEYVDLLTIESKLLGLSSGQTTSLYWGGGTPTMLDTSSLKYFLQKTSGLLSFSENAVVTIESNVENLTTEKLDVMAKYANRLSIGVQRFTDINRLKLGRNTKQQQVIDALKLAAQYFDNINIDIIYGVDKDSVESIMTELSFMIDIGIRSATLYKQEFFVNGLRSHTYKAYMPNNVECAKIHEAASVFLSENGFIEQPIGWFRKEDVRLANWKSRLDGWGEYPDYFGLGPNAYSHLDNMYIKNTDVYNDYKTELTNNRLPVNRYRNKSLIEKGVQLFVRKFRLNQRIAKNDLIFSFVEYPNFFEELQNLFQSQLYVLFFENENDEFILRRQYYTIINWIINDICEIACKHVR
ncbi:MAG: radical SAM protein [Bacteroidales bacterium]|jgi:oxygen-independent coproporphyrinogen-3 oxidase|nr:radical SAM protein [Bacteroidales bacterium]